jgi:hypothetical protein
MDAVFLQTGYVIKQQGLSISGKYCIYNALNNEPVLYVEKKIKWFPPSSAVHVYLDEKRKQEVLVIKDRPDDITNLDVIDSTTGQKIGGIDLTVDNLGEFFKDAWAITDAEGKPIAKIFEKNTGQAILRGMLANGLPQKLDITVGETLVGEIQQKVKMIGYELMVDFSLDVTHSLDRRLGLVAAIHVAIQHEEETS